MQLQNSPLELSFLRKLKKMMNSNQNGVVLVKVVLVL
jgi:hypothetical protein